MLLHGALGYREDGPRLTARTGSSPWRMLQWTGCHILSL